MPKRKSATKKPVAKRSRARGRSSVEPLAAGRPRRLAKYGRRPRNPSVG